MTGFFGCEWDYLEPDSLGATGGAELVEGLGDDEPGGSEHCPSTVDQLVALVSADSHHSQNEFEPDSHRSKGLA